MKRKMKNTKIIVLCNLLILFTVAFSAFCADVVNSSPKAASSATVTGQSEIKAAALPTVPQTPDNVYSYNPLGKPDPFKPFVAVKIAATKKDGKVESIFPLQREDAANFKLVGIVGDQTRRVAVVEDSAKKFYPVFIGTRIGLNNGKVTDILADRVTVDELEGKKIKRLILKLRKNI